jgi:hypothetical protein
MLESASLVEVDRTPISTGAGHLGDRETAVQTSQGAQSNNATNVSRSAQRAQDLEEALGGEVTASAAS